MMYVICINSQTLIFIAKGHVRTFGSNQQTDIHFSTRFASFAQKCLQTARNEIRKIQRRKSLKHKIVF